MANQATLAKALENAPGESDIKEGLIAGYLSLRQTLLTNAKVVQEMSNYLRRLAIHPTAPVEVNFILSLDPSGGLGICNKYAASIEIKVHGAEKNYFGVSNLSLCKAYSLSFHWTPLGPIVSLSKNFPDRLQGASIKIGSIEGEVGDTTPLELFKENPKPLLYEAIHNLSEVDRP